MHARTVLSVLAGLVFACAQPGCDDTNVYTVADDAAVEAGTDLVDATAPARPPLPRYSVPVDPGSELEQVSYYPVTSASGTIRRGTLKLEYPFPLFLSGTVARIELEGSYEPGQTRVIVSAGPFGEGECDRADGIWVCTERLPGIEVDRTAAEQAMIAAGLDASEIAQRLQVTERFSIDPIGIFEMDVNAVEQRDED